MNHLKNILTTLLISLMLIPAFAQDRRTLETKVADILARFPAENSQETSTLTQQIIALNSEGIASFCDMIIPPGTGNDTQARYAITSLAKLPVKAGSAESKLIEENLIKALEKANDNEVKAFFMRQLAYCGQEATVDAVSQYLNHKTLASPAISTLTSIGTDEAAALILQAAPNQSGEQQVEFIKALGVLNYQPAEAFLIGLAESASGEPLKQTYAALARIGGEASAKTFSAAAKKVSFAPDETETMLSYLEYTCNLRLNGHTKLSNKLAATALKKFKEQDQLHYRSAALKTLRANQGEAALKLLAKEFKNEDKAYRMAVLTFAQQGITEAEVNQWVALFPKQSAEQQTELLYVLAHRPEASVLNQVILPSLASDNQAVRQEAALALAINQQAESIPTLLGQLKKATDKAELAAIKKALLSATSVDDCNQLAAQLNEQSADAQVVLIEVLAARRAHNYFNQVEALCKSSDNQVSQAAYQALARVAQAENTNSLLSLLQQTSSADGINAVQQALIALYNSTDAPAVSLVLNEMKAGKQTEKLVPVLPFLNDQNALNSVVSLLKDGNSSEQKAAFKALTNWSDASALPALFNVFSDNSKAAFKQEALAAFLKLTSQANIPADQKLLWLDKVMPKCTTDAEKQQVIRAAGNVKTFLSLVFVANYLDNEALSGAAASAAMKIALPTPGEQNGLTGTFVRETLTKVKAKISGADSQYFKIDIQEYLDKMPQETGYVSLFNGKDLSGWQGLVKNPIARAKMSEKELAAAQVKANTRMHENWSVKDNMIVFDGKGDNLCTVKNYGDFEMIVDWRITKEGDSGIYLRGTPQVQIWDTSLVKVGAQVGSGGLYNNTKHRSTPLVVADNPVGDWNTFRIKMVGDKVTVYLNGVLVVDNVTMENYWDRSLPIFSEGPIELQAHGNDLTFRNVYVRELNAETPGITEAEKAEGFVSLFNGKDLNNWVGNKTDYLAEDGVLVVRPAEGGHGNLYTEKDYSNFIFRFEFQLTPGANNGLGIHAPLEGDVAYVGKELQILDNTAPIYANLKPYQYHGSVYGIITAKRGFLNPVGEWNYQEVIVNGDDIKITLNGEVILEGNMKEASKNGTADKKNHPGLKRHTGRICFLGHGSDLKFRNIRIKEL
ncbi:family 16 glycoside hydrolase [Sunxiuqinia rutila]|uniref:family 16 glycoside hydrolase n=1 Tax=Sunxiuqinia rutila TaxID=1397841 RepID=UPI003D365919